MANLQHSLFADERVEDPSYLKQQLLTYIGNKRALLPFIEAGLLEVKRRLGRDRITVADLFSGSGVVARMMRRHARVIHCNDLEQYSAVVNRCYQTDAAAVDARALASELARLRSATRDDTRPGFIADLYAPINDLAIVPGERVFYTRRNAIFLDAFCRALETTPEALRPFVLAPVLSQASMYANTSGVFKGFYKNREGVGQFGGTSSNALTRILRHIEVTAPILSQVECEAHVHRQDANNLVRELPDVDVAYLDPPYNQHPYGSNYFMLNLLCDYRRPAEVSRVSGIPTDWNRSAYNKPQHAADALFDVVRQVRAKFVLISYSSEGFITPEHFREELARIGTLSVMDKRYNTFRGCRNLADRAIYVTENLYLVEKP